LQVAVPLSAADDDNQGPDSWGVVDEVFVETGLPKDRDGKVMAPRHKRNGQQAAGGAQ